MLQGKRCVRKRFQVSLAHHLRRSAELHPFELGHHFLRLRLARFPGFLRVDGFEHLGDEHPLLPGHLAEDVAVEVYRAALVFCFGEHLLQGAHHALAFVARDHLDARKPAPLEPKQEVFPGVLRLGEALGAADDLAAAVAVDSDGDHDAHVLVGSAPAALEVDTVDEDVGVFAGKRPAPPFLDALVGLLVEVGDRTGRHAGAPEDLADVLDPARRDACQVHLDYGLLDAGLAPAVTLDHRRLERGAPKLGHVEHHLARRCGQLSLVVPAAVGLAVGGSLVLLGPHHLAGLLFEQRVDGVLDCFPYEFLEVALQRFLID